MGDGYSASSSASSGNKVGVTVGAVTFGNQGNAAGSNSWLYLALAVVVGVGAFLFIGKKS